MYQNNAMLVKCRSCRTLFQVSAGAKSIRCFLCQAITKIGDPRAHEPNEAKQRQLKAILDQLTPQNFGKLFEQVKQVNIDSAVTLTGFVSQMFDKALMEPTSCEMYANFCFHLAVELPNFSVDNKKITFKKILLSKCQEEFEREANRVEEEKTRMLRNIRLIGELYKKKMLPKKIMHKCIKKLLGQNQTPDEEDIESLCRLMSTIGVMIDRPKRRQRMDAYFNIMTKLSNNMELSSRVRFMLKDTIDLRNNKWQQGFESFRCMPSSSAPVQATSIPHSSTASATVSSSAASPSEESASVTGNTEGKQKETVPRTQYRQKKTGRKDAKNTQAQHDSFIAPPTIPPPSSSKLQLTLKDSSTNKPLATEEPHAASSHAKRDVHPQVPSAAGTIVTQKPSVHPIPGISMPMPFQSQVPIPFGGLNSQIQSQGVPTTSLQMPMPLSVGSGAHVQQQVFVQGFQSHPIHPQCMMPQGQNLSFTTQIGHQMPPQMASMGIGISSQYSQQPGKLVSHRKAFKITHPDTHEELRLDRRTDSYKDSGSSGVRSHPNVPHQTQPMPPFTPHQISYYPPMQPGSYNHSMYFPTTQTAIPLTSTQMSAGPQGPRYTYPGGQAPTTISFKNPSTLNPLPGGKNSEHPHDSQVATGSVSLPSVQVTVRPVVVSMGEGVGTSSVTVSSPVVSKGESPKLLRVPKDANTILPQREGDIDSGNSKQQPKTVNEPVAPPPSSVNGKHSSTASATVSTQRLSTSTSSSAASPSEESASVTANTEGKQKETVRRTDSFKDRQKKTGKKDAKNTEFLNQEDVSNHAGSVKLSSPRMSRDVTRGFDSMQSPPSDMVELTPSNLSSQDLTHISSLKNGNSDEGLSSVGGSLVSSDEALPDASVAVDSIHHQGGCTSSAPINKTDLQSGEITSDKLDGTQHDKREPMDIQLKQECMGNVEEKSVLPGGTNQGGKSSVIPMESTPSESSIGTEKIGISADVKETNVTKESDFVAEQKDERSVGHRSEVEKIADNLIRSATATDSVDIETNSSTGSHDEKASSVVTSTCSVDKASGPDVSVSSASPHQDSHPDSNAVSDVILKHEKSAEITGGSLVPVPGSKDRPTSETNRAKNMIGKGKKKRKDILKAADAAGSTSDLYMAYKGPEEKQENVVPGESIESSSSIVLRETQAPTVEAEKDIITAKEDGQIKGEPDDWEDAAELSTPKLKTFVGKQDRAGSAGNNEDGNIVKKYSRDFLLTLSEQCTDLPTGFEIGSDIAESLMSVQVGISHLVEREMYPNAGRNTDRTSGGPRPDRRDDDKWNKSPGPFVPGRDPRLEGAHGGSAVGRPGQGGNHGVLRNPRGQAGGQHVGGILSGPAHPLGSQGGMQRSNSDADRWQRATGYHKGLIPSPQTPLQVMHKADKKYEIRKVSDIEEAKQRQLKAILNKLTPQNFDKLFEQVKEVNIDNAVTLTGVISQIFDKALMEPTFCEMYANFCSHLAAELPDFSEDNEKITFKRLLLNKCQEEFERGEREQAEANRVEEEGEIKCSEEEREEKRIQARRRMLGNIRLIGELYKKKMLTERIMHECIKKLLGQNQTPDEEDIESLCKLMSTIGVMIDHPKAKEHMDAYFDIMTKFSNNMKLSSRVRFMLKDSIDLRKNKWQQRRKVEGPKKIDEVHRDAAQERQAQATRLARGPSMSSSSRRGQPMDFSPRGSSVLPSPNTQIGGLRGYPSQVRGYGQDVRTEERHPYESRTLSVPLSQRPLDDNSITLGPQGGLARGMSVRGHPLMSGVPLVDIPPGDPRRFAAGPNGHSSPSEWTPYPREEVAPRYSAERSTAMPAYDQSNFQERNTYHGNRDLRASDRSLDRSMASSSAPVQATSIAHPQTAPEKVLPEEQLRDMSISAIREFYSAKDKDELALCIKELNAPSFYPSMVSIWVTDSFERKDLERDLLARLLVDLTKPRDSLLNQVHLMKGFESVLGTLEDAVNDAPKAAEFLGRILARVIMENVVPLKDIGHLIHEGGEEPGRLLQIGLAAEVLGSVLEIIKFEKGESVFNEIRTSSSLRLEDFRPPDPYKMRKLEAFF